VVEELDFLIRRRACSLQLASVCRSSQHALAIPVLANASENVDRHGLRCTIVPVIVLKKYGLNAAFLETFAILVHT
jgi:hypothetical protein